MIRAHLPCVAVIGRRLAPPRKRFMIRGPLGVSAMAGRYWVVGGEYSDPSFTEPVPGTKEERLGPFDSYKQAHDTWQARAWATVDNCARRYRIIEEAAPEAK